MYSGYDPRACYLQLLLLVLLLLLLLLLLHACGRSSAKTAKATSAPKKASEEAGCRGEG